MAYAGSNWATDREDSTSVSRGAVMYGDSCVGWFPKTQRCVSTSSAKAENISLAECSKEVMFVCHVLEVLESGKRAPPVILREGNEGRTYSVQNTLSSGRTEHMDVRYHFSRKLVKRERCRT